jgi:hypothetical protein
MVLRLWTKIFVLPNEYSIGNIGSPLSNRATPSAGSPDQEGKVRGERSLYLRKKDS